MEVLVGPEISQVSVSGVTLGHSSTAKALLTFSSVILRQSLTAFRLALKATSRLALWAETSEDPK